VFAVKKGTDSSILWKTTVRIACVRVNVHTNKIESHKLLNLHQLLKVIFTIEFFIILLICHYEYKQVAHTLKGHLNAAESSSTMGGLSHDILSTSVLLDDMDDSGIGSSVVECCICLERRPEVILPCAHSYCLPCIEQWYITF
jgi:hypothetical protein